LLREGHHERAVALLYAFFNSTQTFVGTPFPTEWANRWAFMTRLRTRLEAALGQEAYQAAWEQGAALTMNDMKQEVDVFRESLLTQ
jgi:hypothetical protein